MAPWKTRRPIYAQGDDLRVSALIEFYEHAGDDRIVNETFGFILRAASTATRVGVELIVTAEHAAQLAGADRAPVLLAAAVEAGFMQQLGEHTYRLIERPTLRWHARPYNVRGPERDVW
ncbi:hypothetical protein ABZU78_29330 [Rhodococcus erythropolis]|uniref:hypothetical protein n=1 Tax=Rhodococcus erythropolis TaxID=1833 RepID=UPI0033B15920